VKGFCATLRRREKQDEKKWNRVKNTVELLERTIAAIDWADPSKPEMSEQMDLIRAKFKQVCSIWGIAVVQEGETELF
jgi:hypothetical protein